MGVGWGAAVHNCTWAGQRCATAAGLLLAHARGVRNLARSQLLYYSTSNHVCHAPCPPYRV